jgi:hypothetical protein
MAGAFASTKQALGVCDVCGFTYKLKTLRDLYVKDRNTHTKACRTCWNPSQPQLRLGDYPIRDPQALRDPRPDTTQLASSRAIITPVVSTRIAVGGIGKVTVIT